jgi:hypothetical protein
MTIKYVQSDASVEGDVYAQFGQPFDSFTVPPGETVNSGPIPNVLLVKGALASLGIIPLGYLDLANAVTVQIDGGYTIPWLQLKQDRVPTSYDLALSISAMKQTAVALSESSVSKTSTTKASTASSSTTKSAEASTTSSDDVKAPATSNSPKPTTTTEDSSPSLLNEESVRPSQTGSSSSDKDSSESKKETDSAANDIS